MILSQNTALQGANSVLLLVFALTKAVFWNNDTI